MKLRKMLCESADIWGVIELFVCFKDQPHTSITFKPRIFEYQRIFQRNLINPIRNEFYLLLKNLFYQSSLSLESNKGRKRMCDKDLISFMWRIMEKNGNILYWIKGYVNNTYSNIVCWNLNTESIFRKIKKNLFPFTSKLCQNEFVLLVQPFYFISFSISIHKELNTQNNTKILQAKEQ